jgi:hypothetical protein
VNRATIFAARAIVVVFVAKQHGHAKLDRT